MRYLSICSGIEAASVAWAPLGWQCAGLSEIEAFPLPFIPCRGMLGFFTPPQDVIDMVGQRLKAHIERNEG